MKTFILSLFVLLFMSSTSFAAGSCDITVTSNNDGIQLTLDMTADGSGDCDACTFTARGFLYELEMNPGTATDEYDLVLNDTDDLDLLDGDGADMSNALGMTLADKYIRALAPSGNFYYFFGEELDLVGSNMGNAGTATVKIKFSRTLK